MLLAKHLRSQHRYESKMISTYVQDQINAGEAILFLGAGASIAARSESGKTGLSANALRDALCEKFLGGKSKQRTLSYVSAVAIDAAGMGPVHRFLNDLVGDLQPTPGHQLIAEFRWKGIVTTNYDYLVEQAYSSCATPRQELRRIIWDRDDFASAIQDRNAVPYLKLHGCLSRQNDPELPLILSSHDYHKFKKNRSQLFSTLREWAMSRPIIFCGYSISDENIRDLLFDVSDMQLQRPRYVLVDPGMEDHDISYWQSLRFDCAPLKFDDFMLSLGSASTHNQRTLGEMFDPNALSISKFIPSHSKPSASLAQYLDEELNHITPGYKTSSTSPSDFFRGNSDGFNWISDQIDVRRDVLDTLIEDIILDESKNAHSFPRLYALTGYAGSGKSVALKRFAWEAACEYSAPIFYLKEGALLRPEYVYELVRLLTSRIFIIIDDALLSESAILTTINDAKKESLPITFIVSCRTNEWNIAGQKLEIETDVEYELLDLNDKEIDKLITSLEKHNCLGYLGTLQPTERSGYLKSRLKSQLLVALHEATEGKSFEEIIMDEYEHIVPTEARLLYLDVCTLDRLDVGVRAGLLSRVSGITFSDFSERLLRPLEHVISVHYDYRAGDYVYRSRHQHIAQIVFSVVFASAPERARQVIRILKNLNGAYESDRRALTQLIKGKMLADEFIDKKLVTDIFAAGIESGLEESVALHQRAVFELNHPAPDLRAALGFIAQIENNPGTLSPKTVAHTKANILRRLATNARTDIEKNKFRQDALVLLNRSVNSSKDARPFLTKAQILFEELREKISITGTTETDEMDERVIDELTKQIEKTIRDGLQRFQDDEILLNFEADFSKFLDNTPRAIRALESAHKKHKGSIYTTIRLARHYFKNELRRDEALQMIRKIVSDNPTSKESHYELARMLRELDESENQNEIGMHLKRSFSTGDTHYEARFAYARHEFLFGKKETAKSEFASLSRLPLPRPVLQQVRWEIKDRDGRVVWFEGSVSSIHSSFAFVRCPQFQDNIFMHFKSFPEWEKLKINSPLKFSLGFSYRGPSVKKVLTPSTKASEINFDLFPQK